MSSESIAASLPESSSQSQSSPPITSASQLNKVGFIYNPKANKGQCAKLFKKKIEPLLIKHFGPDRIFKILATESPGSASLLAIQLARDGCDLIVACGGDGTLHEVINGVKRWEQEAEEEEEEEKDRANRIVKRPVVGIITMGTSDDFATHIQLVNKKLSYDDQFENMVQVLSTTGQIMTIDLGLVKATKIGETRGVIHRLLDEPASSEYFINIASFGICADIINDTNRASGLWNKKMYNSFQALWKQLTYKNKMIEVRMSGVPDYNDNGSGGGGSGSRGDGSTTTTTTTTTPTSSISNKTKVETRILQATAIGNGSTYGNGMKMCPGAHLNDGLFYVTRIGDFHISDAIPILPKLYTGEHVNAGHKEMLTDECSTLEAKCVGKNANDLVLIETDGEVIGALPAQFTMRPRALEIIVPHTSHAL